MICYADLFHEQNEKKQNIFLFFDTKIFLVFVIRGSIFSKQLKKFGKKYF
jgi:hypothetical protein